MTAVLRSAILLAALLSVLTACESAPAKQWYKPGGNYTTDEFARDSASCTKKDVVDEACLRGRGWVPLSADAERAPMVGGPTPGKERYAPK
jgi:hypothetical protein